MVRASVLSCMLTAACVGSSLPPPTPRVDPAVERDHLIAFSRNGLEIAVIRDNTRSIELLRLNPADGTATRIGALDGDTRREIREHTVTGRGPVEIVFGSSVGSTLIDLGFAPAKVLDTEEFAIPAGRVHFDGEAVRIHPSVGKPVMLRTLGDQREPDSYRWHIDIDERRTVLELVYTRTPVRTTSLWVFELLQMEAEVLSQRAFELYEKNEVREASKIWRRAIELHPNHALSRYNLACAEAQMGDSAQAYRQLSIAIELDPIRFKSIAKVDRDLDEVRQLPEFRELIFREFEDRR